MPFLMFFLTALRYNSVSGRLRDHNTLFLLDLTYSLYVTEELQNYNLILL